MLIVNYVVPNETGELLQWGTIQEIDIPSNAIIGIGSNNTHYVKNGNLTEYTPEQIILKSKKPGPTFKWNNNLMQWEDFRTLEDIKLELFNIIRNKRDNLLKECDWVVTKCAELNQDTPTEWKIYRQTLRDITLQPEFPDKVVWPDKPQ